MARPMMKMVEVGAAPQMAEPISKTMILRMKALQGESKPTQRHWHVAHTHNTSVTSTYHFIS
jgi:hypothetical protein